MNQARLPFLCRLVAVTLMIGLGALFLPAMNSYFFPHFANGSAGGTNRYQTSLMLTSNSLVQSGGEKNFVSVQFFGPAGGPVGVSVSSPDRPDIHSASGDFSFTLDPGETVTLRTSGTSTVLQSGWILVSGACPMVCTEEFTFFTGATTVGFTAGVLPSPVGSQFSLPVGLGSAEPTEGFSTNVGLAVVNTGHKPTTINLKLFNRFGEVVGENLFDLPARGYMPRFLNELFPAVDFGASFHGRLTLTANCNVAVVALKGVNGLFATLAADSSLQTNYQHVQEFESNDTMAMADWLPERQVVISGTFSNPNNNWDNDYYEVTCTQIQIIPVSYAMGGYPKSKLWAVTLVNESGATIVQHWSDSETDPQPFDLYFGGVPTKIYICVTGYNQADDLSSLDGHDSYQLYIN